MIYFDNAATTWPKPQSVINAVADSMKHLAANPARGGHKMALVAGEYVYECRELVAALFGIDDPCRVIFTHNATHGLNIVINGIMKGGGHIICTAMDHNSVLRPVFAMKDKADITMIPAMADGTVDISALELAIKPDTKLVVMTHVSNVCGTVQDVKQAASVAASYGIPFLLDASQSAGILDINMKRDNISFLCAPGHKALYGPMGTGILCINSDILPEPVMYGGTGSYSRELFHPDELPDKYECGTLNFPGICGLGAGVKFIKSLGTENIFKHEMKLTEYFVGELTELKSYTVYGKLSGSGRVGVVSFAHSKKPSGAVADYLNSEFNIATRAMYHCAYPSHKSLGTSDGGTTRVSFGIFNTIGQIKTLLYALERMV